MRAVLTVVVIELAWVVPAAVAAEQEAAEDPCVVCHRARSPGLVRHWSESVHAGSGVACLDCHQADEGDPDAFSHRGKLVATLVTPGDCGRCHEQEAREVDSSYHASAGLILDSKDA
jgi:hypothetical protein